MSENSDEDEFFDAEDAAPAGWIAQRTKSRQDPETNYDNRIGKISFKHETPLRNERWTLEDQNPGLVTASEIKEAERKAKEDERRRRRVEEMRRKMLNEDDDIVESSSEQSSLAASSEGIYVFSGGSSTRCPNTKDKERTPDEARSMISLGEVGSILGGEDRLSVNSQKGVDVPDGKSDVGRRNSHEAGPEPDLVASTKVDLSLELQLPPPVAPPRRKRKMKNISEVESETPQEETAPPIPLQGLPSPMYAVESLARELECSLDLKSAIQGQYVVKPQDNEQDRAENRSSRSSPEGTYQSGRSSASPGSTPILTMESLKRREGVSPESSIRQLNMVMRTRSGSGRPLTDLEILEQVMVLNLDTGEQVPLSLAEDRLPKCINPLSLHLMRLTSEYVSNTSLDKDRESDEESIHSKKMAGSADVADSNKVWQNTRKIGKKIKRTVGKTVQKIKTVADEVYHARHSEDVESSEEEVPLDSRHLLKVKASGSHKGPYEFDGIHTVQEISGEHTGAIWTMKFSSCGRLLATAGQDHVLRIWVLRDAYAYFDDMRQKYNAEAKVSPTPSQESLTSQQSGDDTNKSMESESPDDLKGPFMPKPFCTYEGHTADLLDVSWSKNYFILSSSMDKTVRLWHMSRKECLCCFQHIDFVTAIAFHPRDDRYFLSGSLDGKLRLWNIPDKKVAVWNELEGQTKLITAASFCQNGKFAVVGSYDGRCIFYNTEQLKYYTQIHVRSTRGKNAQGRKISGIEPMPGEDKILVTSNDSRIRLYDLRDLSLSCKYKGYANLSSQIRASFSHDGKYIISGSENQFIYIWKTHHDYSKFSSARRDRNDYWEGIKAHNAVVTAAVFAPNPGSILKQLADRAEEEAEPPSPELADCRAGDYVIVSADFAGVIKVFVSKSKFKT